MKPVIRFVEIENRVISATYRKLMVKAKIVLVEKASGNQLRDPITTIVSPIPVGTLRIKLPATVKPGTYFLRVLNGHGQDAARSADFEIG
ncbi:MAG: hypothetical protein HY852_00650 [Bradyrhizobium sp.]|uniref:hypothetical protein n=1 Tax=Bradyrhizobium sp. TaxID=376 RepID=UPI0025C2BB6B|nr:hypothetical protein [Bradyrhizobium sp.]MBI5260311.1 hypothetical protein [Bradyrhizobium sp.]